MSIRAGLSHARRYLASADIEDAELEAEVLLRHALGLDRAALFQRLDEPLDAATAARFESYVQRRLAREPAAYITSRREFYGLDLEVTPATLIPRPETETLVETAIELAIDGQTGKRANGKDIAGAPSTPPAEDGPHPLRGPVIVDVGTGCGAIAIALARALPHAEVYAGDVSSEALRVARANAGRHGVERRIVFRRGDLLSPLDEAVDLIVANLPYVKTTDYLALPAELRDHEPRTALDGGADGLDLIRRLLHQARRYLRPGGAICLEFGAGQEEALTLLARRSLPGAQIVTKRDLAGRPRLLLAAF